MREVSVSMPGRVKQKTLKFGVLLLCLALSIKELETDWPARSQDNCLGWDINAYPWCGVSVGSTIKTGRGSDKHKTGPVHAHHIQTRPCSETKPLSLVNLVPVAIRLQKCQLRLKTLITHSLTHSLSQSAFYRTSIQIQIWG